MKVLIRRMRARMTSPRQGPGLVMARADGVGVTWTPRDGWRCGLDDGHVCAHVLAVQQVVDLDALLRIEAGIEERPDVRLRKFRDDRRWWGVV